MSHDRVFEGKDLEEALREASRVTGIAEPDLDYEILEQGRRGIFGLGAKSVRIRVMPPVEAAHGPIPDLTLEAAEPQRTPAPVRPPAEPPTRRTRPPAGPAAVPVESRTGSGRGRRGGSRRERRGQDRRGGGAPGSRPPREAREARERTAERRPAIEVPPEQVASIESTLNRIFELAGLELTAHAEAAEAGVGIRVAGPDEARLAQDDGEPLAAFQFLLNRMARRTWPEAGRIRLSSTGERRRRDDDLVEATREVAEQVRASGTLRRLRPMNAYERRLVHLTVREFDDLDSRSEGGGPLKRVRIFKRTEPD